MQNGESWVLIFPKGRQMGDDGRGPYNLHDIEKVIEASTRQRVELAVDYDHATDELPPGQKRIAAGWMKELQARADGLYARIQWTPEAQKHLNDKEYRYISPVFSTTEDGTVTRIYRAGLTNDPNLEVKALAAAENNATEKETTTMDETMTSIAALVGLGADATPAAVLEAVKQLKDDFDKVKEEVDAPADATGDDVAGIINDQIAAAKKVTASKEEPDPTKFVPIAAVKDLQDRLSAVETAGAKSHAETAVAEAIKAGKLSPAMKDWGLRLAAKDPAAFVDFLEKAPPLVIAGADGKVRKPAATAGELDEEQLQLCRQLRIKPEDYKKTLAAKQKA